MSNIADAENAKPDLLVTAIEKVLDWPWLIFVLILVIFLISRRQIFMLVNNREVEVILGNQTVKIGKALEQVEQETDVTRDELDALKEQVAFLMQNNGGDPPQQDQQVVDVSDEIAVTRMKSALSDHRFTWRSIERLALEAGIPEERALGLLVDQAGFKVGKGKSGRTIARLDSNQ